MRTATTILVASSIQKNARKPLEILRTVPSEGWNEELHRLFIQIKNEKIALSGMDFFFVTKRMLFAMASAIITYELVMLQFNQDVEFYPAANCEKIFNF